MKESDIRQTVKQCLLTLDKLYVGLVNGSKLDEDTQLALALSVSATDTCDTVTRPVPTSPAKDVFTVLLSRGRSPVRRRPRKTAR